MSQQTTVCLYTALQGKLRGKLAGAVAEVQIVSTRYHPYQNCRLMFVGDHERSPLVDPHRRDG